MDFPEKELAEVLHTGTELDVEDAEKVEAYCNWARGRIAELEAQVSDLVFRIRCIQQALK